MATIEAICKDLDESLKVWQRLSLSGCNDEETLKRLKKVFEGAIGDHQVMNMKFGIDMTISKLICLKPRTWLNDEVINFYFGMLKVSQRVLL